MPGQILCKIYMYGAFKTREIFVKSQTHHLLRGITITVLYRTVLTRTRLPSVGKQYLGTAGLPLNFRRTE